METEKQKNIYKKTRPELMMMMQTSALVLWPNTQNKTQARLPMSRPL
jgi:hypothetical protein